MTSALAGLFPHASFVAEDAPRLGDAALLYPEELAHVERAVDGRRAEFATARRLARSGLVAMGAPPVPLVPRGDRAPDWPRGVVGSVTHTRGYCAVVLGRDPPLRSVGVDAETVRGLDDGVADLILTERERAWLERHDAVGGTVSERTLLVFCAKEAFYKCQYPLTRAFLEFRDVEVVSVSASPASRDDAGGRGSFVVTVLKRDFPKAVARLEGRFAFVGERVLCGVELLAPCGIGD